jgi:hypothetical protein
MQGFFAVHHKIPGAIKNAQRAAATDPCTQAKKVAAPRSAAKFREETSKKQTTRRTALLRCTICRTASPLSSIILHCTILFPERAPAA